ncbi:MAG: tryptophan synthase subunit alpha [Candidatus Methylacidiphilales bacterium]
MNRIDALFSRLQREHQRALVAYIAAGDPGLNATVDLALGLAEAGVDVLELGLPFSDPLADGVVNQKAAQRALEAGTTVDGVFDAVARIRAASELPIVFFSYFNPIFHYGLERFLIRSRETGVDGILVLDLPPEEADGIWNNVPELRRISLIAPTTPPERMRRITASSSGFIYYVSREGVTGMQQSVPVSLAANVAAIKAVSPLPVCVGFGISSPEQARAVARLADGVVVGSAIVSRIEQLGKSPDLVPEVCSFVRKLAEAVHQP